MINENYGRQVGKMSPVFNASPLEDCLMIFSRPGVAGIISADGITSNWWRNRYILKHLAGSNPPLDLAKKASIQFMLNVVQFAGRPQIEDADFSNAFSNVSDGIAIEAENLLTGFAKTELTSSNREIPVSMTAGTTLNAAIYYENVGLVLFNYGDGFVIQGNHKLECEKTTMPFLGESQTVKDGIAAFVRSSVINPQILIIPQKELMEDALLWVGVDGARDFILSGLTPETIYGKFSDKAIAEIKARALLFTGDTKPKTDITVAISSPYQLKLLAEKSTEAKQLYLP